MGEIQRPTSSVPPPPAAAASREDTAAPPPHPTPSSSYPSSEQSEQPAPPPPRFDPSRMIGIIRRKALIKDLAAVYHAECLAYCPELLELQRKVEEPFADVKSQENARKELMRPPKRMKKVR